MLEGVRVAECRRLISGPAGIGKTRLAAAAVTAAEQAGMSVAQGNAVDDAGCAGVVAVAARTARLGGRGGAAERGAG